MSDCAAEKIRKAAFAYYPQLRRLRVYCNENFSKEICLQQAADIANLERTYFCTFFHQKVGVCFHCWLALLRIDHAKVRIATDNTSLTRIGYAVGFSKYNTFSRTFKRITGMSPSQYRRQIRPR